ncbi:MAG: EscU/YscU/HrcU family type III secretion system export apparatus switch protein [Burkholderiaceae bacterium]|jgi:flagellar biosynthetic protein FlhB|nr:flagellar type III secretion system protein FlhB [Betaproteobacteria bacterium]
MAEEQSQEDKSLEPTARRLEKAREEGQFATSRDLTTLVLLLVAFLFIFTSGPLLVQQMVAMMREGLSFSDPDRWVDGMVQWTFGSFLGLIGLLALLIIPLLLVCVFAPLSLSGFRPVFAFKMNWSRLDPIQGLGRLVSLSTTAELVKTILKAFLILGVGMTYLIALLGNVSTLIHQDFSVAIVNTSELIFNGALLLLAPLVLIAVGDAIFQKFNFSRQMRMSQEEVKQEMKDTEGSPEIKSKLRQRQRQIAQSRMMAAIERADVVVANPDHYSIALRYDQATMAAPVVVAKGLDALALRIQDVAREHSVPIARIPPLARLMHARLEIGDPVPEQLFEAIAKILAWAYELKQGSKSQDDLPDIGQLPVLEANAKPA